MAKQNKSTSNIKQRLADKVMNTKAGEKLFGHNALPSMWWMKDPEQAYEDVFAHTRNIKNIQVRRRYELAVWQQLYANYSTQWIGGGLFSQTGAPNAPFQRLATNMIASCTDTFCAQVLKTKPRITILPNSSDYNIVNRAKQLNKFLDGAMVLSKAYERAEPVGRDAALYGTGGMLVTTKNNKPYVYHIPVDELIIDYVDGLYDDPQEAFFEHLYPASYLTAKYPQFREKIWEARNSWRGELAFMTQLDRVLVVEGYRTPSATGAGDGVHIVAINNCTLEFEEYKKDYNPILRNHFTPPTYGPWGIGIACRLEGLQWQLSEMMRNIGKSIHLFAVPRLFIPKSSGLSQNMIQNDISVHMVNSTEGIQFITPQAMSNDVYSYAQWIYSLGYKEIGISEMQAQASKPAGLNSGIAIMNYQDISNDRFALHGQRWERLHVDVGKILIDLCADLAAKGINIEVQTANGRSTMEQIDWKNASLEKNEYELQAYPTNLLASTPEGRLEQVQNLIQSGLMPRDVALGQLRIPNLNSWIDQETASRDLTQKIISNILDKGAKGYISPLPIGDTNAMVSLTQKCYIEAQLNEVDPEKLDLLLRFLNECLGLQAVQQQQQQMQQAPQLPSGQAPQLPPAPLAQAGTGPQTPQQG